MERVNNAEIRICNRTPFRWQKTYQHSYKMKKWDNVFPDFVEPYTNNSFAIEYVAAILEHDSSGEVRYQLMSTPSKVDFEIQARCDKIGGDNYIQMDYKSLFSSKAFVNYFPYPFPVKQICRAGDLDLDSEISIALCYSEQPLRLPNEFNLEYVFENWMGLFSPIIKNMELFKLTIPGTHDSGTFDCSPDPIVVRPYVKTQNLTFEGQLKAGARCIDIRTGYYPSKTGDNVFRFVHGIFPCGYTIRKGLLEIKTFSESHPQEIIILDFHSFVSEEKTKPSFDFEALGKLILETLGDSMINRKLCKLPLKEIWKQKGRIIVCYGEVYNPNFCDGINQEWAGSDVGTTDALKQFISKLMNGHGYPADALWGIEAVLPPSVFHHPLEVPNIKNDLRKWYPATSDWALKSSIINSDFIETNLMTNNCIGATLIKSCPEYSESSTSCSCCCFNCLKCVQNIRKYVQKVKLKFRPTSY